MKTFIFLLASIFTCIGEVQSQTVNKAPEINLLMIDGKKAPAKVYLNPGEKYLVKVAATDPENDKLTARWELFSESEMTKAAEEKRKPVAIPDQVTGSLQNVMLDVPILPGSYKLFLHVTDSHKNQTTASMPLIVLK